MPDSPTPVMISGRQPLMRIRSRRIRIWRISILLITFSVLMGFVKPALAQHIPWNEASAAPTMSSADRARLHPPQDAEMIVPVINLERAHLKVGEPILLNVAFKNLSPHFVEIRTSQGPWAYSVLTITDSTGKQVQSNIHEEAYSSGSGRLVELPPGRTISITPDGTWFPLVRWGYQLPNAGTYRLTMKAAVFGPSTFNADKEQSSTAMLTIDR